MGFFKKITTALLLVVVLVTSKLAVVQILERLPASFFSYDAFFPDHSRTEKTRSKRVAMQVNKVSVYSTTCIHTRIAQHARIA